MLQTILTSLSMDNVQIQRSEEYEYEKYYLLSMKFYK